jgi:type IV pilus assembly protein PilO
VAAVPRVTVLLGLFLVILVAGWWFFWDEQLRSLEPSRKPN